MYTLYICVCASPYVHFYALPLSKEGHIAFHMLVCPPPPPLPAFEEGGAYCFENVSMSDRISRTCATCNLGMLNPRLQTWYTD